jgi:TolB-like protein/Flp pilus assembly protein TadD
VNDSSLSGAIEGGIARDQLDNSSSDPHEASRPPDAEIHAQIERIIKSKLFADSLRLQRFLSWTVDQVLQGEAQNIKQFTIGQEVFDRGAQFDPRIDSIVRTEAQRLRRKLSDYYRSQGLSDPIQVSFEPGSYVPVLKSRRKASMPRPSEGLEAVPITTRTPATAVMPFQNLTGYADQDYFCRGIAESIRERLANSPNLKVLSTYSAFRLGAETQDGAKIGRELGVNTIVEGSVQLLGPRIRIHAKAVDLPSGSYIWARLFDREMRDLFAIQDEIARAVADALTEQSGAEGRNSTASGPSTDVYRLYLRGRHYWNKVTVQGCEEAVRCFLRTISVAPDYSAGYAALAEAYHWLIFLGARSPFRLAPITRRLVLQALRLDENCPEAYIALAVSTAVFELRWDEAEILFRRGLELRPNYVAGYSQRAFCRLEQGHIEESRSDIEKALDLDPLSARSHRGAGLRLYLLHDFANAILSFDRALELGPDIENTHYLRGLALLQLGRTDEAIAALTQSLEPSTTGARLGALVAAYTAGGHPRKAQETLRRVHQRIADSSASSVACVHAYSALGQTSQALDWLERAVHERYTGLMYLKLDPLYDSLRNEPRFQAVLKQTNLG